MNRPFDQIEQFKKFFDGLLKKKSTGDSQKSFLDFLKHLRHRYKNTGNPIKIRHIEEDCSYMVLEDDSQWKVSHFLKPQPIYWSPGETVVVYAGRGGGSGVELYSIKNFAMKDDAHWTFHGFLEE